MSQAAYIQNMLSDAVQDEIVGASEVVNFYKDKNVLITGATGFLGLLLTERILRSLSEIKALFLFVRAKKGKSSQERFEEFFNDVIFDRLKKEKPRYAQKVVLIEGDMGLINLGLSPEQRELLKSTHIVIHGAATVRFNEQLRIAANINVRGTRELLSLAKEMADLKAFVHISTAFSHCISDVVHEEFYPPPINFDKLLNLLDILDDTALDHLTPVLLGKWPNTYAFTKAVAEDAVRSNWHCLPLCIIRPSIVTATSEQPVAGWINNVYGPTGIAVGVTLGLMRTMHCDPDKIADLIPADYVINNIIVAAWDSSKTQNMNLNSVETSMSREIKTSRIYNITTSSQRPITWRQFMKYNEIHGHRVPSMKSIWYYCFTLNKYRWVHNLYVIFLHILPAIVVDSLLWLTGRKPMLWASYKKIHKFNFAIEYFTLQQWLFDNTNVRELWNKLRPADRSEFDFNVENLNWDDYTFNHIRGFRVYMVKDPMETVPQARVRWTKLALAHYTLVAILWAIFAWLLWICFQSVFL